MSPARSASAGESHTTCSRARKAPPQNAPAPAPSHTTRHILSLVSSCTLLLLVATSSPGPTVPSLCIPGRLGASTSPQPPQLARTFASFNIPFLCSCLRVRERVHPRPEPLRTSLRLRLDASHHILDRPWPCFCLCSRPTCLSWSNHLRPDAHTSASPVNIWINEKKSQYHRRVRKELHSDSRWPQISPRRLPY